MNINMTPAVRNLMLSTADVARREGVTTVMVSRWCLNGLIWPCQRLGTRWLIAHTYILATNAPGRPRTRPVKEPSGRAPGRPKGSKNKRPYPKGVKRPRKTKGA